MTGGALSTTLAALAPALALFWWIDRAGRARGARRLPPRLVAFELTALAGWVLAALALPRLPLAGGAAVLMAALVALLALHTGAQLLALRPLLGKRLPERPSWLFLALPFAVYLTLLPWSTAERPPDGDEPWYLLITHSLAYDFDADLTNNYAQGDGKAFLARPLEPQPGDPKGRGGELYSRHNALLPLLLAPGYRLAGLSGALLTMALLAATLAWQTLRLARHDFAARPGEALLAYGLLAFAPPLLLYSYQIWVEVPAALLALVAYDAILSLKRRRLAGEGEGGAWDWAAIGFALVALPLLKIRFMLLAAPLLLLAWWHAGRPLKPALVLGLCLLLVGGGILGFNQLKFDNPLKIHTWQEVELNQYSVQQYFAGATGLFYDGAFGLFACAPLWMLLLPAALRLARQRHRLLADLLVFVAPYAAIVMPRSEWYGGWSPPFRYALVALPLLALLLIPLFSERRSSGARLLIGVLGLATLALTLLWVAEPGWTYNFADGRTYLLDHLSARFGADVARLFPSSVRWRTASWVWPLATVLLVPLLWWVRRPRLRHAWLWGLVATLLLASLLTVAARALPTLSVELEDSQVTHAGGHLYPDRWVIERTRYRGGWVVREGEAISAPIVAGGKRVQISLEALFVRNHPGPLHVEIWARDHLLGTLRFARGQDWQRRELPPVDWPQGAHVVIKALAPPAGVADPKNLNGVIVDRLELAWQ